MIAAIPLSLSNATVIARNTDLAVVPDLTVEFWADADVGDGGGSTRRLAPLATLLAYSPFLSGGIRGFDPAAPAV